MGSSISSSRKNVLGDALKPAFFPAVPKGFPAAEPKGFPAAGSKGFPAACPKAWDKDGVAIGVRSPWLEAAQVVEGVPTDASGIGRRDGRERTDGRSRRDFGSSERRGGGTVPAMRVFFVSDVCRGGDKAAAGGRKIADKGFRGKKAHDTVAEGTLPEGNAKEKEWALVSLDAPEAEEPSKRDPNPYRHCAVKQTGRVIAAAACWDIAAESKSPLADTMRLLKETSIWSEMYGTARDLAKIEI